MYLSEALPSAEPLSGALLSEEPLSEALPSVYTAALSEILLSVYTAALSEALPSLCTAPLSLHELPLLHQGVPAPPPASLPLDSTSYILHTRNGCIRIHRFQALLLSLIHI